jgi:hypothetical protein
VGGGSAPAGPPPAPAAKPATASTDESVFAKPINLDARLDRILLRENLALRDAALTLNVGANERITGFALNAAGPGPRGKLTGRFAEANGTRTLILESDSGGDFVRAFTGFRNIRDGRVSFKVNFGPEAQRANADYAATFLMNNFTVADQPFLARLFSSGSLDGPLHLLQGDGIAFSQLEARFTSRGRVLSFRDGRAHARCLADPRQSADLERGRRHYCHDLSRARRSRRAAGDGEPALRAHARNIPPHLRIRRAASAAHGAGGAAAGQCAGAGTASGIGKRC